MEHGLSLTDELIQRGVLHSSRLIDAWKKIDRADFITPELCHQAEVNVPLPIGCGQTISQPYTVAFMLELLSVEEGNRVLDVGSGSGWQTALLAELVGSRGAVYALEIIPELKAFGEDNVRKYSFVASGRATFCIGNGWEGLPAHAPYDRIICAAAADRIPEALLEELTSPGKLVLPVGGAYSQDIVIVERDSKGRDVKRHFPGFVFVPFVKEGGQQ